MVVGNVVVLVEDVVVVEVVGGGSVVMAGATVELVVGAATISDGALPTS